MAYFREIRKSGHYRKFHEESVPWSEVVYTIFSASKRMRKKGGRIEITDRKHYVLCELKGKTLWVINAKRK